MKPPVRIDDLMEEWSKDAPLDTTEPTMELSKIPLLHAKYLYILTHHNLIVKKLTSEYNKKKLIKYQYYAGDLNNPEDLEKYGYEPWAKTVLKPNIPMYVDSDEELNNMLLKKMIHQEIVDFCSSVLKEISARGYHLSNIVKWETYIGSDGKSTQPHNLK